MSRSEGIHARFEEVIGSIVFHFICIALNHRYSLKGLNRPIYLRHPPDPSPPEGKKNSLNQQVPLNLEKEGGRSLLPRMIRSAIGVIIDIHTFIHTGTYRYHIFNW